MYKANDVVVNRQGNVFKLELSFGNELGYYPEGKNKFHIMIKSDTGAAYWSNGTDALYYDIVGYAKMTPKDDKNCIHEYESDGSLLYANRFICNKCGNTLDINNIPNDQQIYFKHSDPHIGVLKRKPKSDPISPEHYSRLSPEPKDVIRNWDLNFNLGNVIKYIARAGHKDSRIDDLLKAKQYLDFEIEFEKKRLTSLSN
jgi:hypothetical protein